MLDMMNTESMPNIQNTNFLSHPVRYIIYKYIGQMKDLF